MRYQTIDPTSGETLQTFETLSDSDVAEVMERSDTAFRAWRAVPLERRVAVLKQIADAYRAQKNDIAHLIHIEMGKQVIEAEGELDFVIDIFDYYAEHGPDIIGDEELHLKKGGRAFIRTKPVGSILGIMPWNYPHYQVARLAAPNLLLGNAIVLKHAPLCPQNALKIEQLFLAAGLPGDVFINIFGTNAQVDLILSDPRNHGVSLTGSERAGSAVGEAAGRNLKKCVLELGGSDAFILLDSADIAATAREAAAGRMYNAGQACNSPKRFIILDELYDPFLESMKRAIEDYAITRDSDSVTHRNVIGPVASRSAADNIAAQVSDAVAKGATALVGGRRADGYGSFFEPTLLTGVTPGMRVFDEEVFGPVAVVYRAADEDQAIEIANNSAYGLSCCIYSTNIDRALRVADQLDTGMAWINGISSTEADLPFGGVKKSGYGRELGREGIFEFANRKVFRVPKP